MKTGRLVIATRMECGWGQKVTGMGRYLGNKRKRFGDGTMGMGTVEDEIEYRPLFDKDNYIVETQIHFRLNFVSQLSKFAEAYAFSIPKFFTLVTLRSFSIPAFFICVTHT